MLVKPYKEYLPIQPNIPIHTGVQGSIMNIEIQGEHIVLYFDANSEVYHKYNIYLVETGKEVDIGDSMYIKTLMMFGGAYVLHVYMEEVD